MCNYPCEVFAAMLDKHAWVHNLSQKSKTGFTERLKHVPDEVEPAKQVRGSLRCAQVAGARGRQDRPSHCVALQGAAGEGPGAQSAPPAHREGEGHAESEGEEENQGPAVSRCRGSRRQPPFLQDSNTRKERQTDESRESATDPPPPPAWDAGRGALVLASLLAGAC